jgi:hypothetical protein
MKFPLKKITAVGFSRRNSKGKNKGLQPKFTRGNVWLKPKILFYWHPSRLVGTAMREKHYFKQLLRFDSCYRKLSTVPANVKKIKTAIIG